jgi:hypothetical protein
MSPHQDQSPSLSVANAVQSIEQDFARVHETLGRILEAIDPDDCLVTARVHAMIEFAHRGMALSHQLLDVVSSNRS